MLRYKCLVLDHDDTVVQSEATVNYPCFCRYLEIYRPGQTMTLEEYVDDCNTMSFMDMCAQRFQLTDEEMDEEYRFWKAYAKEHIPAPYPGMKEFLHSYRSAGGIICVSSMSSEEMILRDYQTHFGFTPDLIFGCDLPEELRKPGTYALEQTMKTYDLSPEDILVVDDMKAAVTMAQNAFCAIGFAGWGRVDYPAIFQQMQAMCNITFHSVREFSDFVLGE